MSAGQSTAPDLIAAALPAPAIRLLENQAEAFVRAAKAPSTLRAYRSDWDHFTGWCRQHTLCPLPASPETIALYLTALGCHAPAGNDDPAVDRNHQSSSDCRTPITRHDAAAGGK